jgi:hypothetical protein
MLKWKNRRSVLKAHEQFTIKLFLEWFNKQYRSQFMVIKEPDPPEAIIKSGSTVRWVEVTAAFWSDEFAQDLCSYATEGEPHKSIGDGSVSVNPTAEFVKRFLSILKKKLEKKSYEPYRDRYGPGYLVVSIQYPFFDRHTMIRMTRAWTSSRSNDLGCFRSVYLAHRTFGGGYKITRWRFK